MKSFTRWLTDHDGGEATAILAARGPRYRRKLPRPLTPDDARDMIETVDALARADWIAARDVAVVTLLYGCGLRISEALSLTHADQPLGDVVRITGKGGKERLVPVIPAARAAVDDYVRLCPLPLAADPRGPLFRGARGGALNPRLIARAMEQARGALGLPATATPTRCAIPSQPTSSPRAAICAPSRNSSATPRSPPPRPIPPSTPPA